MTDNTELNKKLKDAGMMSIEEMLEGHIMGKFSTHVAVNDMDSLYWWVKSQYEKYLRMRLQYELGEVEKDDMYEWVFAHSAVFGTIKDHMDKVLK